MSYIYINLFLWYLPGILHVMAHRHHFDLYFSIYPLSLIGHSIKYQYCTVSLFQLLNYSGNKTKMISHAKSLIRIKNIHEILQHSAIAPKISDKFYYHVSADHQGYDAFSCNPNKLAEIQAKQDVSLMSFYEKKMIGPNGPTKDTVKAVSRFIKRYRVPKVDDFHGPDKHGARPCGVNHLEIGTYREDCYHLLKESYPILNRDNPLSFELIIKDYSPIYEHVSFCPNKCRLLSDTTISDEAFEGVKLFYRALEKQEEMCVYFNNLLDANVLFPLVQVQV